eukprot:GEZU01030469.1.p1 GENE.GEZU01030469.1~~GEZU01030469.1.p1  ORF type:complete len:140 (-),score=23.46 GEZU01030469.1:45-443(-)
MNTGRRALKLVIGNRFGAARFMHSTTGAGIRQGTQASTQAATEEWIPLQSSAMSAGASLASLPRWAGLPQKNVFENEYEDETELTRYTDLTHELMEGSQSNPLRPSDVGFQESRPERTSSPDNEETGSEKRT